MNEIFCRGEPCVRPQNVGETKDIGDRPHSQGEHKVRPYLANDNTFITKINFIKETKETERKETKHESKRFTPQSNLQLR